jgi:hypothetical protein
VSIALERNQVPSKNMGAAKKLIIGIGSYSEEYGRLIINNISAVKVKIVKTQ